MPGGGSGGSVGSGSGSAGASPPPARRIGRSRAEEPSLHSRTMSGEDAAQLAGLAALIGHCFTIFLKFKGGKGTATFLGVMLGLSFPLGLACCASWLATAYFLRISSLSALVAAASSLLWALIFGQAQMVGFCAVLALLVFERHRANIFRLKAGIEPKIGQR